MSLLARATALLLRRPPSARHAAAALLGFAATGIAACSSATVVLTPQGSATVSPMRGPSLPAAIATGCIQPTTETQTTSLPAAGGVSGTITIGAFASASAQCMTVTLATGADATLQSGAATASALRRSLAFADATAANPLVQVALTDTYTGGITEFTMTLQLPPSTVPAGQYPCRIASTTDLGDGSIYVTYTNFTITVSDTGAAVVTGPSGARALAVLGIDTTGVLSIYPPGTTLPSPTPVDTATPSSSPTPVSSASAVPTVTPSAPVTVTPTTAPTPVKPSPTPSGGLTISIDPDSCIDAGYNGFSQEYSASVNMPAPSGQTYAFAWSALAEQPAYTVDVPPPTSSVGNNGTLGLSNSATIMVPAFSMTTGETGESGAVVVTLYAFSGYDSNGNPTGYPVTNAQGNMIRAGAPLEAGSVTCQSQGLSSRSR